MARVRLIQEGDDPALQSFIDEQKAGRGGKFLNLYKVLLHSPALAKAWKVLIDTLRQTKLDVRLREIAIIRAAIINDSAYEIRQHIPRYAEAAGLKPAEWEALRNWRDSDLFSARDRAVLAYTDSVTKDVHVPDDVIAPLREHLNDQELVELTVVIAVYNMHARVMEPLRIDLEP